MAGKVLTKDWLLMSPLMFECMMYLKYNESMQSLTEVVEATKRHNNMTMVAKARQSHLSVNVDNVVVSTWEAFKLTE